MKIKPTLVLLFAAALIASCGNREQMLRDLEMAEKQNRDYVPFTSDSTALALVSYFDSHGTANERMRAHYILGCAYRDLGEFPRALECYNDAAAQADTTKNDCDYKTLSRVHGQRYDIMLNQYLLDEALNANSLTTHYAMIAGDTLMADVSLSRRSFVYSMKNQIDSALYYREKALGLYKEHGYEEYYLLCHEALFPLYIETGDYEKARHCMNVFESKSRQFDEKGNITKGKEIYYYDKGRYYLAINKTDSAEYFFRKTLIYSDDSNCREAGNKGLYLLYNKIGNPDSAAKYAAMAYETNNKRDLEKASAELQRAQLNYNYTRNERLANEEREEKQKSQIFNLLLISFILLASCVVFYYVREINQRKKLFIKRYRQSHKRLVEEQNELLRLNENKNKEIIAEKIKRIEHLGHTLSELQKKHDNKKKSRDSINAANVVIQLHAMAINGKTVPSEEQWSELSRIINEASPDFYTKVNSGKTLLSIREYRLCMLTYLKFRPAEICNLLDIASSYVTHMRSRLLAKIFEEEGNCKKFDERIASL